MVEKRYILTEAELLELLENRINYAALDSAGVYDWPSFESANDADPFPDEEEVKTMAKEALENYEEFC